MLPIIHSPSVCAFLLLLASSLLTGCGSANGGSELMNRHALEQSGPPPGVPEKYAVLWKGFFASEEEARKLSQNLPYDRITLERGPCYGTCPVYRLGFNSDGTADYTGIKYTDRAGPHAGKLGLGTFARLCYFLEKERFESLQDNYTANWTDDATCVVSVYKNGALVKSVRDYGRQGPIELWAIQELLDGLETQVEWTPSAGVVPSPKSK